MRRCVFCGRVRSEYLLVTWDQQWSCIDAVDCARAIVTGK